MPIQPRITDEEFQDIRIIDLDLSKTTWSRVHETLRVMFLRLDRPPPDTDWSRLFFEERDTRIVARRRGLWIEENYISFDSLPDEVEKIHLPDIRLSIAYANRKYRELALERRLKRQEEQAGQRSERDEMLALRARVRGILDDPAAVAAQSAALPVRPEPAASRAAAPGTSAVAGVSAMPTLAQPSTGPAVMPAVPAAAASFAVPAAVPSAAMPAVAVPAVTPAAAPADAASTAAAAIAAPAVVAPSVATPVAAPPSSAKPAPATPMVAKAAAAAAAAAAASEAARSVAASIAARAAARAAATPARAPAVLPADSITAAGAAASASAAAGAKPESAKPAAATAATAKTSSAGTEKSEPAIDPPPAATPGSDALAEFRLRRDALKQRFRHAAAPQDKEQNNGND